MYTYKLYNGPGLSVAVDIYKNGLFWTRGQVLCSEVAARNWAKQQGLKEAE
jgi:hypothetical protein